MDLSTRLQSSQGCSTSSRSRPDAAGMARCEAPRSHRRRGEHREAHSAARALRRAAAALASALSEQQPELELRSSPNGKQTNAGATQFVAETLLPTRYGSFRVRAYRHQVRAGLRSSVQALLLG